MPSATRHHSAVKKIIRIALWAAAVVVLLLAAAVVVMHFIDWRQYANSVAAVVKEQTGRRLEIGGPVKVGIFPIRVLVDDVTFANAPGGSSDVMVTVKRVGARLKLTDLIHGKLSVKVDLDEPDVLLETVASGKKNWSFNFDVPDKLAFVRLLVSGGQIVLREHPSGNARWLVVDKLVIREKLAGGYKGHLEANLNDVPVELDVDVKPEAGRGSTPDAVAIKGRADISTAVLDFDGQAFKEAKVPRINGKLRADIPDTEVLGKFFQAPLPGLPSITIAASIMASGEQISVDDVKAAAGKSSFTGTITANLAAKRPRIDGTVSAKLVDIVELMNSSKKAERETADPGTDERLISNRSLAVPPLDMADIKLTLAVDELRAARDLTFQNLQTVVSLESGRLTVKPLKMSIAGADFNLTGNADGLGRTNPSFSASLFANGVDLGELLKSVSGKEDLNGGRTEVIADLQAAGGSPKKVVSTLKGHVRISVGPGRLNNRNLDELLGDVITGVVNTIDPFYTKENSSELKCLAVNVQVKEGVILIDDTVALETNNVGVSLAGFVNLKTEKIDLLARPMAKEGLGIGADLLSDLVRIRGTLANPQTEIDPVGVAKTTVFRGIDVATFGLTALAKGLAAKISADQVCEEALRKRTPTITEKGKRK